MQEQNDLLMLHNSNPSLASKLGKWYKGLTPFFALHIYTSKGTPQTFTIWPLRLNKCHDLQLTLSVATLIALPYSSFVSLAQLNY